MMAYGTASNECTFPIGGKMCENTCDKKMDEVDTGDNQDNEVDAEEFGKCMSEKCLVQMGICTNDAIHCSTCLGMWKPTYCYTNTNYMNVIDCGMCNCLEGNEEECERREKKSKKFSPKSLPECTQTQNIEGGGSLIEWASCAEVGSVSSLLTDWDENNFGGIDSFEACAHEYNSDPKKSNRTALECTQILVDIMASPTEMDVVESITAKLYTDAPALCDCTYDAYDKAPLCKDFARLRTILHETLDACNALDQIDCPAWEEFSIPCKKKMEAKFNKIDFKDKKQCEFIEAGCGGVGPFPVFRRQDCGKEISKLTWDFHTEYGTNCDTTKQIPDETKKKKNSSSNNNNNSSSKNGGAAGTPVNPAENQYAVDDDDFSAPKKKYVSPDKKGVFPWILLQLKRIIWVVFWVGIAFGIFTIGKNMDWDDVNDRLFHYSHRARENHTLSKVSGALQGLWTKITGREMTGVQQDYQHIPQGYSMGMGTPETEMFMPSRDSFQPPSVPGAF